MLKTFYWELGCRNGGGGYDEIKSLQLMISFNNVTFFVDQSINTVTEGTTHMLFQRIFSLRVVDIHLIPIWNNWTLYFWENSFGMSTKFKTKNGFLGFPLCGDPRRIHFSRFFFEVKYEVKTSVFFHWRSWWGYRTSRYGKIKNMKKNDFSKLMAICLHYQSIRILTQKKRNWRFSSDIFFHKQKDSVLILGGRIETCILAEKWVQHHSHENSKIAAVFGILSKRRSQNERFQQQIFFGPILFFESRATETLTKIVTKKPKR